MCQTPHVLRARNFRLYLADNSRLVDLWQNGGAAVLGHTPPNLLRELKNAASRGLYAPYPHFTESRFLKALSKLLPERNFRLYAAPPQELIDVINTKISRGGAENTVDTEKIRESLVKIWRPFVDPVNPFAVDDTPILIPVIPGIQTWRGELPLGLCAVAVKTGTAASEKLLSQLPLSDTFSPILLAAAARGVYDLLAAPERAKPLLPRIIKALQQSRWQRNGIYLTLKEELKVDEWDALFNQFLEAGFLIPPTQSFPVILPGELSDGEEAKLAAVLKN